MKKQVHNHQMSTDDFKSLAGLHAKDVESFHKGCDGVMEADDTIKNTMRSWCGECEMLVTSTKATVSWTRSRDGKT